MGQVRQTAYGEIVQQIPAKDLSILLNLSSALASTLELSDVLQIAIKNVTELLNLDTGAIYTLDGDSLFLGATTPPLPPQFPNELRFAHLDDHPHIKETIEKKASIYLADTKAEELSPAEKIVVASRNLVSILYYPLLRKDKAIGSFIVGTTDKVRKFSQTELELCNALSCQAALAISNAQLYEQSQNAILDLIQAYDSTLEGWSLALEMRDHDTDKHANRATDLTVTIATRMGILDSELVHIRHGALLHDIGKMGIPDSILRKPAALTDAEWKIMETHPELAYQFLSKIDYLKSAIDIPYCHHEKWDGTGYPRKLVGEEIPLSARIFAVADVFDALTSDRPYRKAWKQKDAIAYIAGNSGGHFFPDAVTVFLQMMNE